MVRKLVVAMILFIGAVSYTFGQNQTEEVVYLKNGSIIRGLIIEETPNESIKIETKDGNVFFYSIDEIDKIAKEKITQRGRNRRSPSTEMVPQRKKGPSGMIQFAGMGYTELADYSEGVFFESQFVYGYRFNPYLFVGGGIGFEHVLGDFEYYNDNYSDHFDYNLRIPVFATVKANLNKKRVSPFFQLDLGYKLNTHEDTESGVFCLPKFGLDFNLGASKRCALFLALTITELGTRSNYYYNRYYSGLYSNSYGEEVIGYYEKDYHENSYGFNPKIGLNFGLRF